MVWPSGIGGVAEWYSEVTLRTNTGHTLITANLKVEVFHPSIGGMAEWYWWCGRVVLVVWPSGIGGVAEWYWWYGRGIGGVAFKFLESPYLSKKQ